MAIGGCFKIDGLSQPWKDRTFVNPPYSEPLKWVRKAIEENRKGKTVALLLKLDSSTKWYLELCKAGAHIIVANERLHFSDKEAAPFCSMIAILFASNSKKESESK